MEILISIVFSLALYASSVYVNNTISAVASRESKDLFAFTVLLCVLWSSLFYLLLIR